MYFMRILCTGINIKGYFEIDNFLNRFRMKHTALTVRNKHVHTCIQKHTNIRTVTVENVQ